MAEPLKIERRGGARPNSGPKTTSLSSYQVARMLRKARKYAKRHGKDLDDLLLEFAYEADGRVADRLGAIKLFKDLTMPKISEGGEADRQLGPAVFLPSQRPTLTSVEGGKAA